MQHILRASRCNFYAAATAANKQRIPLAKMAVQETGMGVVEDKVKTTMLPNIYIMHIRTQKLVVLLKKTKLSELKKLLNQ